MIERRCGLCGAPICDNEKWSFFKVEKEERSSDGWSWEGLEVHDGCWQLLCHEIANKRAENDL